MIQSITAPDGCKIVKVEHDEKSLVIVFDKEDEEPKFKRGDFLTDGKSVIIFDSMDKNKIRYSFMYMNGILSLGIDCCDKNGFGLATEKEKQQLLDILHSHGYDWDAEKCETVPYIWKPKQGTFYFIISQALDVYSDAYYNTVVDKEMLNIGNCFKSKAEAQKYADKFKKILKKRGL